MNKNLTKIAALSVSLAMAIGVGVALGSKAVRNVRATDGSVTINNATSNTDGVLTVAIAKASGSSAPITGDYGVRLYAKNTVTITSSSTITALTIPWTKNSKKAFASVSADVGTYTHPSAAGNGTWSGSATSIVLTVGDSGQVQFNSVSYTVSGSSGPAVNSVTVSPTTMTLNLQGTTSRTITPTVNASGGADETVTWSVLNDNPTDCVSVSNAGVVTAEAEGTATVRATSTFDDTKYADCAVTVLDEPVVTFELVTSVTDLEAGSTYAITNSKEDGSAYAMSNAEQLKYRQYTSVTISDNTFEAPQDLLRLTLSGSTDEWVFTTENYLGTNGTLYPSSAADKNELYVGSSDSTATISFEDGAAVITLSGNSDGRGIIRWNNNSGQERFSCYKSGQQPVYLWKEVGGSQLPSMHIGAYDADDPTTEYYAYYHENEGSHTLYLYDEDNNVITDSATFTSSNDNIFAFYQAVGSHGYSFTTVAPGTVTLTASVEGYESTTRTVTVDAGTVTNLSMSGSMTKTSYSTTEDWDPTGFSVTATYNSGYQGDVTSDTSWGFVPEKPAEGVTSVIVNAFFGGLAYSSEAQAVTVTVSHAGTEDDPFTIAEGIAKAKEIGTTAAGPWYVKGIISKVNAYDSRYTNITYWISEDGSGEGDRATTIECFRGRYLDNGDVTTENSTEFTVGKLVVVRGNLLNYNSNTPEFDAGNYLISIETPTIPLTGLTLSTAGGITDVKVSKTLNIQVGYIPAATSDAKTVTWASSDNTIATVADGVVTGVAEGEVTITATSTARPTISASIILNVVANQVAGTYYLCYNGDTGLTYNTPLDTSNFEDYVSGYDTSILSVYNTTSLYANNTPFTQDMVLGGHGSKTGTLGIQLTSEDYVITRVELVNAQSIGSEKSYVELANSLSAETMRYNMVNEAANYKFYPYANEFRLDSGEQADNEASTARVFFEAIKITIMAVADHEAVAYDYADAFLEITAEDCAAGAVSENTWKIARLAFESIEENYPLVAQDVKAGGEDIEAIARYKVIIEKYGYVDYLNKGYTQLSVFVHESFTAEEKNTMMVIVITIAAVSVLSIGVLLVIKKRKHN